MKISSVSKNVSSNHQQKETKKALKFWFTLVVLFFGFCLLAFAYKDFFQQNTLKENVIEVVSATVWTEMKRDQYGNVNVLLLWYGGENHDGWYLTDSIIIASWNPEIWNVSMFSIPRDLWVKYPRGWFWKINAAFYQVFRNHKYDFSLAWNDIVKYFEDISWIEIPYYAMVDFSSFKEIIDVLWWIDIEVPETLHDTAYPWANHSYVTFHLDAWMQHLDWETALKYARSRHSTSDFSRSLRQQQIISGIKDKILASWLSVDLVQQLYDQYQKYVITNVDLQNMLRSVSFLSKLHSLNSYWFTTVCWTQSHERMQAACFLYTPNRENFGWLSVILPDGATSTNVSNYSQMQWFFKFIVSNPLFWKEKANVGVQNWIDRTFLTKYKLWNTKIAGNLAVKMKKYGFTIGTVENADYTWSESFIQVNTYWNFSWTIAAIQKMIPLQSIVYTRESLIPDWGKHVLMSWYQVLLPSEQPQQEDLNEKDPITIFLWEDYIVGNDVFSWIAQQSFSYVLSS